MQKVIFCRKRIILNFNNTLVLILIPSGWIEMMKLQQFIIAGVMIIMMYDMEFAVGVPRTGSFITVGMKLLYFHSYTKLMLTIS